MNERTTHTTDSSGSDTSNSWMDHPAINGMDPVKLELIRLAAKQTAGKSGRSLALITSANKKGIQFTPQEMPLILDILKDGRPAKEQEQIDQMVQMIRTHMKNHT